MAIKNAQRTSDANAETRSQIESNPVFVLTLSELIASKQLDCVFQPIVDLERETFLGYEGLIRGPHDTALHTPAMLFRTAQEAGMMRELNDVCEQVVREKFSKADLPGYLFLNVIPSALEFDQRVDHGSLPGAEPHRIVIEITEIERIQDNDAMLDQIEFLRGQGYSFAIDDLGEGFATFRMWSELRPDFVKIDKHFVRGIATDRLKQEFVSAILRISECAGCKVIAEGIETSADLETVRLLGIRYAQGYLLCRPVAAPPLIPDDILLGRLRTKLPTHLATTPEKKASSRSNTTTNTAYELTKPLNTIQSGTSNDDVAQMFLNNENLSLIPVVDDGLPLGLLERYSFVSNYVRPYAKELFGRKSCRMFMQTSVPVFDHQTPLLDLVDRANTQVNNQFVHGMFITRGERYFGVVSGRDLVSYITSIQIETARYANPLTMLPGNVPINKRIEDWLKLEQGFATVYADLDHFKPFNDAFGYKKGDDLIQTTGRLLLDCADASADFVGHIGGDDFLVLFRSSDWIARCERILELFSERLATCLPLDVIERGNYSAEDRQGKAALFELPTLSLGAVFITPSLYDNAIQVASAAAEAKKQAKKLAGNSFFVERRG